MFARRALTTRAASAVVAASAGAMRFQGGGRRQGGGGGGAGGLSPQQQRQMQQEAAMQRRAMEQMQQADAQGMQEQQQMEEGEEGAPAPPPEKPENSQFTKVEIRDDGIAVVSMARAPVNSLNLEFFTELADWFMWLSTDEANAKAIVLTSEIATVFSAGIDIAELHKPEMERFEKFWLSFQEIWLILNSFPKPVIAAINGNAPAGGCILSMCCDYRVMARASLKDPANPKAYRIGLNETKLGLIAPPWVMKSLAYTIGERKAEKMLQLGETPTADEALTMGLVDKVVAENEVMEVALQEAAKFGAIPADARWMSKDMMRRSVMQFFQGEKEREYDVQFFAQMIQNPDVEENVGKYLARLQGGAKRK